MKKYTMLLIIITLLFSTLSFGSFANSDTDSTNKAKPTVIIIDGKEVIINAITENGQLFLAIDELAPAIDLKVDTSKDKHPEISSKKSTTNLEISKASLKFSINLLSNDSVGDEWNYYIKVNNNTYNSYQQNSKIELTGNNIPIELTVYEYDKSKSDFGFSTVVVPYSELKKGQPLNYTKTITVTENGGRYSGNTATVQFNLTVTPE